MHHPSERLWRPGTPGVYAVIATDGACRNNGYLNAIAGCGIFWDHNSTHNKSFQLNDGVCPTSQRAELTAAIRALKDFAEGSYGISVPVDYVVIKTDSSYLVKSVTNWIVRWRRYGWVNSNGDPVSNQDLITELDRLCDKIYNDFGVKACFWKVGRDDNKDADHLAKVAIR